MEIKWLFKLQKFQYFLCQTLTSGFFFLTSFLHIKQNHSILKKKCFSEENFNQFYSIKHKAIH